MDKNYVIKSVVSKIDAKGKCVGYSVNYHHKNYPDSIQSQFYSVDDMKDLGKSNETQVMDLKGKEIGIIKKLVWD